jgi:hypothetical protein
MAIVGLAYRKATVTSRVLAMLSISLPVSASASNEFFRQILQCFESSSPIGGCDVVDFSG